MFKIHHLFFTLSLLLVFACKNEVVEDSDILNYRSEVIALPIDYSIFPSTFAMQYFDSRLYWMNRDRRTIHQLDFKEKKFKLFLKYQEEGPDGLGSPLGFYLHNLDSIFFPTGFKLSLINQNAKVQNVYDFLGFDLLGPLTSQSRYTNQFINLSNGILLSLNPGLVSKNLLNKDFLNRYYPFLVFNPRSEQIKTLYFKFDPFLFNNGPNLIGSSFSGSGVELFVLTRYNNILHKYDVQKDIVSLHTLESNLVKNFSDSYFKSEPRNNSANENLRLMYKYASNIGLLHDPYRNLVYRMGWKGDDLERNLNIMKFSEFLPQFVVSVYDSETLNLFAEFDLPKNKYLAHHYFVSEDGLNLFLNHPDDPNSKEDEIIIEVFDFSKLK